MAIFVAHMPCPICKTDNLDGPHDYCTGCNRIVCSGCYSPFGLCVECQGNPPDEVA